MMSLLHTLAVAAISLALTVASVAEAGVVFGNLGASGTDALGGTNTDYGPLDTAELEIAQSFYTGQSADLTVQSITLGLFTASSGSNPITVSIREPSVSGTTPGNVIATSGTVQVGNTGLYTFPFSNVSLVADGEYWIVPSGPASWYTVPGSLFTFPGEQNSSGYSSLNSVMVLNASNSQWEASQINSYAVSINAVPEPPAVVLSGIGLASVFYAMRRRRG
jgi:hypothetical protein